jgi:hypothetical protein
MHVDEDQLALAQLLHGKNIQMTDRLVTIFLVKKNTQMITEVHKLFFTDSKGQPDRLQENPRIFL